MAALSRRVLPLGLMGMEGGWMRVIQNGIGNRGALARFARNIYTRVEYDTSFTRPKAPRTSITNPSEHTTNHVGLWYTIDKDTVQNIFTANGIPKQYTKLCNTLGETSLMIRQPALTVIDFIKKSNLQMPPNKFMLYGNVGCGKTMSLVHITHFLAQDGWILLHVPIPAEWRRTMHEITVSPNNPELYDHHYDAVLWLQQFKAQNIHKLSELQLTTSEEYIWSRREKTSIGEPLLALIDLGIGRTRYASGCVMAITSEIKRYAQQQKCKVALIVDGINSFFCPTSLHKLEDKTLLPPQRFTLYKAFSQLFTSDWINGVIVGSIDMNANDNKRRKSYLPRYVLRQQGWETLDPFVAIPVVDYNDVEMYSVIDYYAHCYWLQSPNTYTDVGRQELAGLSNHNPLMFRQIANSL